MKRVVPALPRAGVRLQQLILTMGLVLGAAVLCGCGTVGLPLVTPVPEGALGAWQSELAQCRSDVLNVVILGDSRSIVDNTIAPEAAALSSTFGQKWTDRLAATLRSTCGSHGSGLVPFLALAQNHELNGDFYTVTGDWTTTGDLGPSQGGGVPAAMTLVTQSALRIGLRTALPFDHLVAYCAAGPSLQPWTLEVDGQAVGTCGGGAASLQPVRVASPALPATTHSAALVCVTAPCIGYGLETTNGTTGVSVHNLAIASCTAECFGSAPETQLAFSDLLPTQSLVLVQMVTNEPGVGYSPDSFRSALERIILHSRAHAGAPSVVLIAPLQDALPGQEPFYDVLPGVVSAAGTGYVDLRSRYGTAFLPQYFSSDQVHENNAGHAVVYAQVAGSLLP